MSPFFLGDLPEVQPDAKSDMWLGLSRSHGALNSRSAFHRGDCRLELGQKPVSGQLDQTPPVLLESRSNQAIADVVEHRACQSMLGAFFGHRPAGTSLGHL